MPRARRTADPAYQRERARRDPFEAIARRVITLERVGEALGLRLVVSLEPVTA
jgi:hypothetical protein